MAINFQEENKQFHLATNKTSYIMRIIDAGYLAHIYYGKRIRNHRLISEEFQNLINLEVIPQEYSAFGTGEFRTPSYEVQFENGTTTNELKYQSHRIISGKPGMEGLPSSYALDGDEVETLEITLLDDLVGLKVVLYYSVFPEFDVITRRTRMEYTSSVNSSVRINRIMSLTMDFERSNYDMLQLSGGWAREKHIYKRALVPGIQSIDSKRGLGSHAQNPFLAIMEKNADENHGEVYGFNLVYSGNFLAEVEVDQYFGSRLQMGINPFDFSWKLASGESFDTPEAVMVYSGNGLGEMSRTFHRFYRSRMCRGKFQYAPRPILINNWEATYFNFNADKIEQIAMAGKELGIELFVLDDGWFGKRNSDNSSLGDWVVDRNKLPDGLDTLVNKITSQGMQFGLWFEPEMISPDSDLYREHPDWCIHVPDRKPMQEKHQRWQLVLDLSRKEICDKVIEMVSDILKSAPITYVKWDMNRTITDFGSCKLEPDHQREIAHRYMLGLYYILETVTSSFPDILFESCASGGGRFDPAMLYYMPQTWTSDNTDAIERLKIQYGTSMVYPTSSMGSHISAIPNHQVERMTGLDIRGNVAMSGNFGYELDLTKFTEEEKEVVKAQVEQYKQIRHIIQYGDFYRILSPFEGNETAWLYVTEDKKEAVAFYFKVLAEPNMMIKKLKLTGLSPDLDYQIQGMNQIAGGDELMQLGLDLDGLHGDYATKCWILKAE